MEAFHLDSFLEYYGNVRKRSLNVVACIPPDRLEWTYKPGAFTFGDQIRHIAAIERMMYAENACGRPSRYNGCGTDLAEGYDAVLAYFNRCHAETMDILRGLSLDALTAKCHTPAGTPITVWKWLRLLPEHEIHHRAHIYQSLSMLDVPTPPLYGLTSEQVRDRCAV